MSLQSEIVPYVDGNGLVAPQPVAPGTKQGSDNGVMFTSEYLIMAKWLEAPWQPDFYAAIARCFVQPGLLDRAPGDLYQEGPDDYYGLCAMLSVYKLRRFGIRMLLHGFTHIGFFNNAGVFSWDALLWRQPQMVAAMASAAGLGWMPIFWPFYAWAMLVIFWSCRPRPPSDTDYRRLCWHLIQATWGSPLARLAAFFWYSRLYEDYPNGMRGVASLYYKPGHPFIKYWVDRRP